MFTRKKHAYHNLEDVLGYRFRDPVRLETALTHRSFRFENREAGVDNERLEFLGDAVLGFLLADLVYERYEEHPEGVLTILRSRIVSTSALASVARDIGLGAHLRLGRGEVAGGGRERESMLADAMEALLAALYLDAGIRKAAKVFQKLFASRLDALTEDVWEDNPKGRLQQLAQRDFHAAPVYRTLAEEGPHHARVFRAEVAVGDDRRAEGEGNSKQSAQVAAARALLAALTAPPAGAASLDSPRQSSTPVDAPRD